MTRRALVTGAKGFVGKILCSHLAAQGWEVRGCDMTPSQDSDHYAACDLRDRASINQLLDWALPVTHVFHLAALTYVPDSINDPVAVIRTNLEGTVQLATALFDHAPQTRFIYVGSAEAYGRPQRPEDLPFTEDHPLRPANPYAITKAAADHHMEFLYKSTGADVVRMRPFNHSGPGQSEQFVLPDFARQVARAEAGLTSPKVVVGNLAASRDFSHVSDVVRAYELAALEGRSGEAYNVSSGRPHSIKAALESLLSMATTGIRVEPDPERLRPVDVPEIFGSHAKLAEHTGWEPRIPFDTLLEELLDYWRRRVKDIS